MATSSQIKEACAGLRAWMDQQQLSAEARQAGEMALVGLTDCAKRKSVHPTILAGIAEHLAKMEQAAGQ